MSSSIAIITTSTCTPRIRAQVSFLYSILSPLSSSTGYTLSQVDLATFSLPIYNETAIPTMIGQGGPPFSHPESIAWSSKIAKHAGYVVVIPEYNYSKAGATKNAVDYLVYEWKGKPVMVVSYGIRGGGSLARDQLRGVLEKVGLRVVGRKVELGFSTKNVEEKSGMPRDLVGAMLKGELGESTEGEWIGEGSVEEAWGELVGLLEGGSKGKEKKGEGTRGF